MEIVLDEIISSGTFSGFKIGDNINDFKRIHPDELPEIEIKKNRYKNFKLDPIQFSFADDILWFISLKCYYRSMKFFFEGKPIKIMQSIAALKELLVSKNLSFVENKIISDAQINLEVNQCVSFIYSVEDNGDLKLAQIDSFIPSI